MGVHLRNVSNVRGNVTNSAQDLDTLMAKAIPGAERFRLPSTQERKRLVATGKFLEHKHSISGPLPTKDPRSLVGNIHYVGKVKFKLITEIKPCDGYSSVRKYEDMETNLFSSLDAKGNTVFFIRHGKHSMVLTAWHIREGESYVYTHIRSKEQAHAIFNNVEATDLEPGAGFSHPDMPIAEELRRASYPVKPFRTRKLDCKPGYYSDNTPY